MITFFRSTSADLGRDTVIAVATTAPLSNESISKLTWLFSNAKVLTDTTLSGTFIGPRKEMITPWSTNAVEIAANSGVSGIDRIEVFEPADDNAVYDPMLQARYIGLNQEVFTLTQQPEPVKYINDLESYNRSEGLALSTDEIAYLTALSKRLGRPLTDSEVFGFSQVNSEHCRHKIFNGTFIIDGQEMPSSLFKLIKRTSAMNPNGLVSAYKDNVAFLPGPVVKQFAPRSAEKADSFEEREVQTVISMKAETHNFPTTVEPFNGAATGTGGEIRDRLGGGKASLPIAGTAVYMTSYPRLTQHDIPGTPAPRPWLYQTPEQILIKASNGASDFGNKFGQPLITGSVLTFEHQEQKRTLAYDKVIMLAGGIGFASAKDALKENPEAGMKVVVMGGDNYRIGMGGGAVSSVITGQYANAIELNAVQRANPEMQKRVSNVIRALAEMEENPCVSIHDHGAGGHLNALSELVETTGGRIDLDALPVGDKTLSAKEIVGNESQERMGLVLRADDVARVEAIARREQAPFYVVGETTGDHRFVFERNDGSRPIDLAMADMFGNSPRTVMTDHTVKHTYADPQTVNTMTIADKLRGVLALEAVACKDWLTNKVDRSVTGRVARQQCVGELQLPLADCGVVALDYSGTDGIATSIGHAPQAGVISASAGSVLSIAEALTNICGAPLKDGLRSVSLSANWMWPCRVEGEDARLYEAVKACSDFACALGINIPTGKDSLSMSQKYTDQRVDAPGTVIISAAAQVSNVRKVVTPHIKCVTSSIIYIDLSRSPLALGGSAYWQSLGALGSTAPTVADTNYFAMIFNALQTAVNQGLVAAMHDISAGGMLTAAAEMLFPNTKGGLTLDISEFNEDTDKVLFAENPAMLVQVDDTRSNAFFRLLAAKGAKWLTIGRPVHDTDERFLTVIRDGKKLTQLSVEEIRDMWYAPSACLDERQSGEKKARERFANYSHQPLQFAISDTFTGKLTDLHIPAERKVKAAIIREKGINGDREMAYSLYLAGFDVKDVHMTDLTSGRETLEDVNMIVFCGGFSNSDVLGSAKGWAGSFLFNEKARKALKAFYAREDTMSLGVCNGCQLMMELELITPDTHALHPKMTFNDSHKFESNFISVTVENSPSIMLKGLTGSKLGIWIAHGEGKFVFPEGSETNVALRYTYNAYPANPNGSPDAVAGICSADGRHLAMMPHLERAVFPWQCGYYPTEHQDDDITPWLSAFVAARQWIESKI